MKNANVLVLVIVFALIVLVAGAGLIVSAVQPKDAPPVVSERVSITPNIPEKTDDTQAYLRVQVGDEIWPLIPLTDGGEYTVTQSDTGARNVIRTTVESAVMHFSTCDNQNCVQQGEVALSNRELRVMGNLIVCLPNEVVLELLEPGEVK
ncbi:MAG: NusG domain II-containing protein [Clostridia bacterium]|nr:NusG domain II-containing protein [Clostridia bacterium]